MPTEHKTYTPGAERAAERVSDNYLTYKPSVAQLRRMASEISETTHDAEMLEALRLASQAIYEDTDIWRKITALIAKVECR